MKSRTRLLAERVLTEAPGNNNASAPNTLNIGDFSSTFNTAETPSDLNLSNNLEANSIANNNIEVNDSFDDFNYESNFNTPSSSFGGGFGGANFGGNADAPNTEIPNTKTIIQTITDYFPNEGTVELTNEEGVRTIKPLAQVIL